MTQPIRVLIAYDGSNGARIALGHLLRRRAGLPDTADAVVLSVADAWDPALLQPVGAYGLAELPMSEAQVRALDEARQCALNTARALATDAAQQLRRAYPGWTIQSESCSDAPAWGIITRAEAWRADIIVMGSHGRSTLGRLLLGSVSQAVVREAPCAVRVVRGRLGTLGTSVSLMIGFDGSPDAEAAVEAVASRAWPAGSTVRLVTAIPAWKAPALSVRHNLALCEMLTPTWMDRMIEDPVQRLHNAGLSVSTTVKRGDPQHVLINAVKHWSPDSLFVGARGLRGMARWLMGSVSTAVAMQAPCSVEVVRAGHPRRRDTLMRRQAAGALSAGA